MTLTTDDDDGWEIEECGGFHHGHFVCLKDLFHEGAVHNMLGPNIRM